jgi:hypothetical protein
MANSRGQITTCQLLCGGPKWRQICCHVGLTKQVHWSMRLEMDRAGEGAAAAGGS